MPAIGRSCKISSHTFVCEGVNIEDNVFIGHGVTFINDLYPRAQPPEGELQTEADWKVETTLVRRALRSAPAPPSWQRHRRRERHRRRGQRGDQRRARQRHRRRESGKVSAVLSHRRKSSHDIDNQSSVSRPGYSASGAEAELLAVVKKVFRPPGFIGGPMVEDFERDFAAFCDAKYCVGVGSGTDALRFAFMAAGVEPGDIVVTVPHTFIATTEAISQAGAQIAFVDIDERTYKMEPEKLREYLETRCDFDSKTKKLTDRKSGKRVTAIVPVHLYGQTADMDPIMELAAKYNAGGHRGCLPGARRGIFFEER